MSLFRRAFQRESLVKKSRRHRLPVEETCGDSEGGAQPSPQLTPGGDFLWVDLALPVSPGQGSGPAHHGPEEFLKPREGRRLARGHTAACIVVGGELESRTFFRCLSILYQALSSWGKWEFSVCTSVNGLPSQSSALASAQVF